MATYDIINDYVGQEGPDISSSPDWCVVSFRFANPLTFSRKDGSISTNYEDAVRIAYPVFLRDVELFSVQTVSSKSSHLTQMSIGVAPTVDALNDILPGDWICAWMAQDSATIQNVLEAVRTGKPANGFLDGLKFMGRVGGVRKVLAQTPEGLRTERYTVTASGFTEFDATLFYEPHLAEAIPELGLYFASLGAALNQLIENGGEGISVNKALPLFLDLLLGTGIRKNLGLYETADERLHSTAGLETREAAFSYIVPNMIGSILGKKIGSKTMMSSADTLEFLYGRQEYDDLIELQPNNEPGSTADPRMGQLFSPAGTKAAGPRRFTGNDMLGIFLPTPPQFSNHSVWSILNQYLNPAVNEMYTCLRVNPEGRVVPTLVARQLPFSSPMASSSAERRVGDRIQEQETKRLLQYGDYSTPQDASGPSPLLPKWTPPPVTPFLSLPRWKAHPALIQRFDVGRSDAMRVNFIHVYGDDGPQTMNPIAGQIVLSPPIRDDLDIARSGLRPFMQTVANAPTENVDGLASLKWMSILADIMMGQQLTLTGTVELKGVTSPICPGDNFEFDGVVFHIESVTHSAQIGPGGTKSFVTVLALSHGVSVSPGETDVSLFAGVSSEGKEPEELKSFDPGVTADPQTTRERVNQDAPKKKD